MVLIISKRVKLKEVKALILGVLAYSATFQHLYNHPTLIKIYPTQFHHTTDDILYSGFFTSMLISTILALRRYSGEQVMQLALKSLEK